MYGVVLPGDESAGAVCGGIAGEGMNGSVGFMGSVLPSHYHRNRYGTSKLTYRGEGVVTSKDVETSPEWYVAARRELS
jgi:hypothetical protein